MNVYYVHTYIRSVCGCVYYILYVVCACVCVCVCGCVGVCACVGVGVPVFIQDVRM